MEFDYVFIAQIIGVVIAVCVWLSLPFVTFYLIDLLYTLYKVKHLYKVKNFYNQKWYVYKYLRYNYDKHFALHYLHTFYDVDCIIYLEGLGIHQKYKGGK